MSITLFVIVVSEKYIKSGMHDVCVPVKRRVQPVFTWFKSFNFLCRFSSDEVIGVLKFKLQPKVNLVSLSHGLYLKEILV